MPRSRADLPGPSSRIQQRARRSSKRQHRWRRRILYALPSSSCCRGRGRRALRLRQLPLRPDQEDPRQAPGRPAGRRRASRSTCCWSGSDSPVLRRTTPRRSSAFGNEADAGGQRSDVTMVARFDPGHQDGHRAVHPPRPLGRHPRQRQRDLGHEPHQRGLRLRARPPHPDDRAGPRHPDQPLRVRRLPRVLGHGRRAGRHHHGLPDPGQGPVHGSQRDHRRAARW